MTLRVSIRNVFVTISVIVLIAQVFTVRSAAQNGSQFTNWASFSDGVAAARPKMDCRALLSLTGYQFSIETSKLPLMGVDYYEGVRKRFGSSSADFFRLYMVPGMLHCRGGSGPSVFDPFTPLVNWVERKAPAEIGASQPSGAPPRTRPFCPYPEVARHKGTGSTDDAANFVCRNP